MARGAPLRPALEGAWSGWGCRPQGEPVFIADHLRHANYPLSGRLSACRSRAVTDHEHLIVLGAVGEDIEASLTSLEDAIRRDQRSYR
jgi:hypothetical protein